MAIVLHHCTANPTHKLILLGIANHQGDRGAFPSIDTLAAYANVSRRTVSTALRELERRGDLICESKAGRNSTNLYWVQTTCPAECDRTPNHRTLSELELKHAISGKGSCNTTSKVMQTVAYKPLRTITKPLERNENEIAAKRLQARQEWKALETDMQKAKAEAVEMPDCKHGIRLLSCLQCCEALAKETN
mgnify:FL=1